MKLTIANMYNMFLVLHIALHSIIKMDILSSEDYFDFWSNNIDNIVKFEEPACSIQSPRQYKSPETILEELFPHINHQEFKWMDEATDKFPEKKRSDMVKRRSPKRKTPEEFKRTEIYKIRRAKNNAAARIWRMKHRNYGRIDYSDLARLDTQKQLLCDEKAQLINELKQLMLKIKKLESISLFD